MTDIWVLEALLIFSAFFLLGWAIKRMMQKAEKPPITTVDESAKNWARRSQSKESRLTGLIYPFSMIVAFLVAQHYWLHWSEALVGFIIILIIGEYERDKITNRLDAVAESVESLKESLEELSARVD